MSASAAPVPRFQPLRPGPPGTVAGDLHADAGQAAQLLRPAVADHAIEIGRRAIVGNDCFRTSNAAAMEKLNTILDGGGVLVSTGQQPGLFLGPLFTLYKVLTAASHARRIETATGRPALASFWVAGDDHDWDEVGAASIVDRSGAVQRFALEPTASESGTSVGAARLGARIEPILADFLQAAGESEFAPQVSALLRSAYTSQATVTGAFMEGFAALLSGIELAVFDPSHSEARRAAIPFISSLLRRSEATSAALEVGTARVVEAGYEVQLRPPTEGTQVFFDDGRVRAHLIREAGGFRHGRAGDWRSLEEWMGMVEAEPARFSPAAATRPLLESTLLPVARTVLGPGEMAYWAQLGPLFEELAVHFPQTVSRNAWLIIEPKVERWLEDSGVTAHELEDGGDAAERRLTEVNRPESVDRGLRALRGSLTRQLEELADTTRSELPGLDAAFGKTAKGLQDALTGLEGTIDRRVADARKTSIQRARRAAALLYPEGRRQERIDSPVSFLVRYGEQFLREAAIASGIEPTPADEGP